MTSKIAVPAESVNVATFSNPAWCSTSPMSDPTACTYNQDRPPAMRTSSVAASTVLRRMMLSGDTTHFHSWRSLAGGREYLSKAS